MRSRRKGRRRDALREEEPPTTAGVEPKRVVVANGYEMADYGRKRVKFRWARVATNLCPWASRGRKSYPVATDANVADFGEASTFLVKIWSSAELR